MTMVGTGLGEATEEEVTGEAAAMEEAAEVASVAVLGEDGSLSRALFLAKALGACGPFVDTEQHVVRA